MCVCVCLGGRGVFFFVIRPVLSGGRNLFEKASLRFPAKGRELGSATSSPLADGRSNHSNPLRHLNMSLEVSARAHL